MSHQPESGKGDAAPGSATTLRTCIVSRAELPPEAMLRFVAAPDGTITPDIARRLPGRGVWITCDQSAVAAAVLTKAFARSLRREVKVPGGLVALVERLLERRALDALSLANKAGLLVAGFAKVEARIGAGRAGVLIHAADAGADGVDKLSRRYRAVCREAGVEPVIIADFTIAQLSLAIGRPNVVHAVLDKGGATSSFTTQAGRLARFRRSTPTPEGPSPQAADRATP